MTSNVVALSECVKLSGHTEQQVVTCNVQTQLCKGAGSSGCCEELIDDMNTLEGQDAQMRASSLPSVVPSNISKCLSRGEVTLTEAFKTSAFDPTILAESSGMVLQPTIMVAIGLASHCVQL
ncbi:hypothetical protein TNCV_2369971 [Trichonephila clavipes]|nr:hypothetical protein TNCV_2369971 [Trichonephila clavipes]